MLRTNSVASGVPFRAGNMRILVTRYRGRFLPKSAYDIWMPSLGPSEKLLRAFQGGTVTWAGFTRAYQKEILDQEGKCDAGNRTIKNHGQKFTLRLLAQLADQGDVTLLCHCPPDAAHCHRYVLEKLIRASRR